MEHVFDHEDILEQVDRAQMLLTTRHLLTKHGPEDGDYWKRTGLPGQLFADDGDEELEQHIQKLMSWRLDEIPTSARGTSLRERHALLGVLVKKHQTLAQRFGQGVEHVERRVEYFSGFYHTLEQGKEWQASRGGNQPWILSSIRTGSRARAHKSSKTRGTNKSTLTSTSSAPGSR